MDHRALDSSERSALREAQYISLGTYRRSGDLVRTPVWFAEAEGRLWVFTAGEAGKVKRLRHTPEATLARCDAWGRRLGPIIEVRARCVEAAQEQTLAYRALRRKYGWRMWLVDVLSRLFGRIHQRAVLVIEPRTGGRFDW